MEAMSTSTMRVFTSTMSSHTCKQAQSGEGWSAQRWVRSTYLAGTAGVLCVCVASLALCVWQAFDHVSGQAVLACSRSVAAEACYRARPTIPGVCAITNPTAGCPQTADQLAQLLDFSMSD